MKPSRILYRAYRSTKNHLQHGTGPFSKGFFWLLGWAEWLLSENTIRRTSDDSRWSAHYVALHGRQPLFQVLTERPVASTSTDHRTPRGAIRDNTVHWPFNRALHRVVVNTNTLRVLDLGCAGGGFVRSLLEDGDMAVGIEGSDAPKTMGLGEWPTCALHLLTADICEPFQVLTAAGERMLFDVVTAWEVLEHIPESNVPILAENIAKHLRPGGLFVASVDSTPDVNPLTGAVYHVTLQPKCWWLKTFRGVGLEEEQSQLFRTQEFVRGNGIGLKNWDPDAGDGFDLVLRKTST